MNAEKPNQPISDDAAERLSAWLDGELSPAEAADVESRLAADPAYARLRDELLGVRSRCQSAWDTTPLTPAAPSFAAGVVAEALRREKMNAAVGAATRTNSETASDYQVEPAGEFGLPFGKGSRNWAWGLVAAAAAVMLTVFSGDRTPPPRPGGAPPDAMRLLAERRAQHDRFLQAARQTNPNLRVVPVTATPEALARWRQRLAAQRSLAVPGATQLPSELMAVSRRGVVARPIDPKAEPAPGPEAEELVYVDADDAELDRLIAELGAAEPGAIQRFDAPAAGKSAGPRVVPFVVQSSPTQGVVARGSEQTPREPAAATGKRRVVVLRIRVQRRP